MQNESLIRLVIVSLKTDFRFRKSSCKCAWQLRIRPRAPVAWRTGFYTHSCMDHGIKGKMCTLQNMCTYPNKCVPDGFGARHEWRGFHSWKRVLRRDSDESSNPGDESAFVSYPYAGCERSLLTKVNKSCTCTRVRAVSAGVIVARTSAVLAVLAGVIVVRTSAEIQQIGLDDVKNGQGVLNWHQTWIH